MRSRWLALLRSPECPVVVGRPLHLAAYLSDGLRRSRWVAAPALVFMAVDLPVMLLMSHFFVWGYPWLVVVAHVVGAVTLAFFLAVTNGEMSIARAHAVSFLLCSGVVFFAAMLGGLSLLSPSMMLVLAFTVLVAFVLTPLRLYQLLVLLAFTVLAAAFLAMVGSARAGVTLSWWNYAILINTLCAGVLAIVINAWQYQSFKAKWKAEAVASRRTRALGRQKSEVERLLVSALPEPVAAELRNTGTFTPVVEEVCVVACDIVGFSKYCEELPATLVVEELQRFFRWFDECCIPRGLEPLRSQGDGVLAIGGLWRENTKAQHRLAIDAILAMLAFRKRLALPAGSDSSGDHGPPLLWSARIGVHTGPVIMGVMDGVRLTFDVWGETVNVAARLEQGAGTNQILVSERSLWATRGLFEHGPVQELRVKDTTIAGAAELVGIRPEFRDEGGQPSEAFWEVYRQDDHPIVAPHLTDSLQVERDA